MQMHLLCFIYMNIPGTLRVPLAGRDGGKFRATHASRFPRKIMSPGRRHDFKLSFRVCPSPAISLTSPLIIRPDCIIYRRSKEAGHVCAPRSIILGETVRDYRR